MILQKSMRTPVSQTNSETVPLDLTSTPAKKRFDKQVVILESHADPISCLAFHAYMPHIVVTDVSGGIGVWNWESGKRLSQFVAPDEKAWRITCLRYIDEAEGGMIMTGTGKSSSSIKAV